MNKLSLNKKMSIVLAIFTLCAVVIAGFGIRSLGVIADNVEAIVNTTVPRLSRVYKFRADVRLLAYRLAVYSSEDKVGMETVQKQIDTELARTDALIAEALKLASPKAKPIWQEIDGHYRAWWAKSELQKKAAWDGDHAKAKSFQAEARKIRTELEKGLDSIVEITEGNMAADNQETMSLYNQARIFMTSFSIISIGAALVLAVLILRATARAIQSAIDELNESAVQVSSAAGQIAAASEELSQASTEQAASLEETAASVEEMSSMISRNSDNAGNAAETSGTCQEISSHGKEVVGRMIESMTHISRSNDAIQEQVEHSNSSMQDVVRMIEEIGSKTKVINDIVFQTKLLSFNASVEAARAGEHGKGFAVVAEEVGNLANSSGSAAKEIGTLLEESIRKVNELASQSRENVGRMVNDGKMTVERGTEVVRECGDVFEKIVTNVSDVSRASNEIAAASKEQAQGVSEITKAMSQLDQMTQQNTATSEECAASASELNAQAEALKRAVVHLVAAIKGAGAHNDMPLNEEPLKAQPKKVHAISKERTPAAVVKISRKLEAPPHEMKRAAGDSSSQVPSYNDRGFKDV